MDFSVVVPCYKSFNTLEIVVDGIIATLSERSQYSFEIILVNDNSPDNTWDKIKELCQRHKCVKAIDLAKNFGQASALMAGFSVAQGKYIVTAEDDGQSSTELIWEMFDSLGEQHDIICARNIENPKRGIVRRLGRRANYFMLNYILECPKDVSPAIFFIAKRNVIEEMLKYDKPYPYIGGLILRSTSKIGNYNINRKQRISGNSGYTFKKLINLLLNGITALSIKPLRVTFVFGILYALISVGIFVSCIVRSAMDIHGNVNLLNMGIILLISSTFMFALSVVGEYIGRIYMCINHEPQYVIRQMYSGNESDE